MDTIRTDGRSGSGLRGFRGSGVTGLVRFLDLVIFFKGLWEMEVGNSRKQRYW